MESDSDCAFGLCGKTTLVFAGDLQHPLGIAVHVQCTLRHIVTVLSLPEYQYVF